MPNMRAAKHGHGLDNVKSKLFVIARETNNCEVIDNNRTKFVALRIKQHHKKFYGVKH